jgi:inner membrane protein involved in colicin E2 resistance
MTKRETRMALGVILTALSFACFSLMDTVEPYSAAETALNMAGYLLAGLALGIFYRAFRSAG